MPIERVNVDGRMGSMATIPVFGDMYEILWDDGGSTIFRKKKEDQPTAPDQYPLITSLDLPAVIKQLKEGMGIPRYAVLMFVPKDSRDGEYVNLQYSVINGAVGLEWVLLGGRNKSDKKAITAFASRHGCEFIATKLNGVKFLRYEGPDLVSLGMAIVNEFYLFGREEKVKLLVAGFCWPSDAI